MRSCVIIPARYKSSRLPGKPLVKLLGKPMVIWVAETSSRAVGSENVYVATDDKRIFNLVIESGYQAILTKSNHLTGTDRVAEAASNLDYDIYVNVQGDEPLVEPEDILIAIENKKKNSKYIINGYTFITDKEDPSCSNIPKLVTSEEDKLIYISRSMIPGSKTNASSNIKYKKQVCIYAYNKLELLKFLGFGRKGFLEEIEDIEILRFYELGLEIKMFMTNNHTLAVDIPSDITSVEKELSRLFFS